MGILLKNVTFLNNCINYRYRNSKKMADCNEMENITALILSGGLGTRLRPVLSDKPKVMASVNDKFFLSYIFQQLINANIHHVVLCVGYLSEQIELIYKNKYKQLKISYSKESHPLGTGGALFNALPLINSKLVLVMNGDSYCNVNIKDYYLWHILKKASASIVLTQLKETRRYGQIVLNQEESIEEFNEKSHLKMRSDFINAGIYLFSLDMIKNISYKLPCSLEYDIFPKLIGNRFYGYQTQDAFIDIGTPESYAQANKFFQEIRK